MAVIKSNLVDFMESPESDNLGVVAALWLRHLPLPPGKSRALLWVPI